MAVLLRLIAAALLVVPATPAAQGSLITVDVAGEHRLVTGDTPESARQFALENGRRQAVRAVASSLSNRSDLAALTLNVGQLEALVAALIDLDDAPATGPPAAATNLRVRVGARVDAEGVSGRIRKLVTDADASRAVVAAWARSEQLHQQLAERTRQRASLNEADAAAVVQEQLMALPTLEANRLVARGYAAFARTELATVGGRAPSAEGRRRAKESVDAALVLAPDSEARALLGDLLVEAEKPEAAEPEYRRALTANPTSPALRTKLAEALRLQGKFPEALDELRETIRVSPDFSQAHSDLAMILRADGKIADAEAEYREAIRLDPRNTDARNGLAITYANSKRLEDAVKEFEAIIAIDPDSTIGYYNLATVLANLDKDIESATALRHVIRIYPDHYNARFNIGELLRLEGKYDDSATQFREYLRLAPDTPQNRRNIERARRYVQQFTTP